MVNFSILKKEKFMLHERQNLEQKIFNSFQEKKAKFPKLASERLDKFFNSLNVEQKIAFNRLYDDWKAQKSFDEFELISFVLDQLAEILSNKRRRFFFN